MRVCSLFALLAVSVYGDRPVIRTENGDLIIEPSEGRSLYLRTRGQNSKIYADDIDLTGLRGKFNVAAPQSMGDGVDIVSFYITGPGNILNRLDRLEHRLAFANISSSDEVRLIRMRLVPLIEQVRTLQSQFDETLRSESSCALMPCKNGGTCLRVVGGYYCICPAKWEGSNCDVDVNECRNFAGTDLGCQNGATCINHQGTYECLCATGWFGVHCTRKARDCFGGDAEICGHGTCIHTTSGSGVKCICDQGWTNNGTDQPCVVDVNECNGRVATCSVNPPVGCINTPGSFMCGPCPSGYRGDGFRCYDIDECVVDNGGCSKEPFVSCHNTVGSRLCGVCPAGFQGNGVTCEWRGSCGINKGGCHPSARCVENTAISAQFVQCVCPRGMVGDGVGVSGCFIPSEGLNATDCIGNPCGNHGICRELERGITCLCDSRYTGTFCDRLKNSCTDQPCKNGGICKLDNSTEGYRCECTALYTGTTCQNRARTCNAILESQEGSIVYPLPNTSLTYNHNARCFWIIRVPQNKVINVTFTKFNLESSSQCSYDFLQIHDAPNPGSNLIGRFCGTDFPKGGNLVSSQSSMYFWFRSDSSVSKEGFILHWTTIDPICGGEIDANSHGSISSPGWPGKYPPNRDCYWHLATDPGKKIELHFFKVSLESHPNCSFDYLSIYAGSQVTDPLIAKYCNTTQPAPTYSPSSEILIHFHSDKLNNDEGFQISYAPITGCGGRYTGNRAEITPPTYNGGYEHDVTCDFEIQVDLGSRIKLKFLTFHLELSSRCRSDYLSIYDGPTSNSNFIGKFCGSSLPAEIISTSNAVFIRFKSDSSLSYEGFRIAYDAFCEQIFTDDSGIITSPGYPHQYSPNRVCDFIVSTQPGKVIQISFSHFDIEDNLYSDCQYDNLKVIDGPNVNSSILGTYCGPDSPSDITSTQNYMLLRFTSDHSISGSGFQANYSTIFVSCGGIHTANSGVIRHPGNDKTSYEDNEECTWIIMAPAGHIITLTWTNFNLEKGRGSCLFDYVLVTEENSGRKIDYGRFCGSRLPPLFNSISNKLIIKFHSDDSVRNYSGFSLTYSISDAKKVCGGNYISPHGYIRSPGWPSNYLYNKDCIWTIAVPTGQQILLNVSTFELESTRNCANDFLEIRNGPTESSPLIGKFCGNNRPPKFTSHGSSLFLHFHSDESIAHRGFEIEWDGSLTGCGGTLTSSSGAITSPNYPQPYGENAECFWKIIVSSGSAVRISFLDIEMENRHECFSDYLEVYDGKDATAPLIRRICSQDPRSSNLASSSNQVFIKFRSDSDIGGKRFYLNYYTDCHVTKGGFSGVIESPDFLFEHFNNLDCLWTVIVPIGNTINASFSHFDLSDRPNYFRSPRISRHSCNHNYLQIKDGQDNDFGNKICGSEIPKIIATRDNKLQIKFITDSYIQTSGFRLEWKADGCGGIIRKSFGTIALPEQKRGSTGPMECTWLIETDPGKSVHLLIYDVNMIESLNCSTDSIEVYNGGSASSPLITKICKRNNNAYQASSTTNLMFIKYSANSQYVASDFRASFTSPTAVCGGSIVGSFGTFSSPNYPKNYDGNSNCVWYIRVPDGHRIRLEITQMDLYRRFDRMCGDNIEIFDYSMSSNNYTRKYCDDSNNDDIYTRSFLSKQNALKVIFTSGEYQSKGFTAKFSAICGSVIRGKQDGILNVENALSSRDNCTWTILANNPEQKVAFTLTHMHLSAWSNTSSTRSCPKDFLRLLDGNDIEAPIVGEYCGKKIPPTFVSHGSALTIQLGAYMGLVTGQFTARYSMLDTSCGGTLTSEEGTLASPGYPGTYSVSTDCIWKIISSPGNKVSFTFEKLSLESSDNCNEDYVEVRDGDSSGNILGVYCGREVPSEGVTAKQLFIKFHSDKSGSAPGFLAHYSYVLFNEISGQSSGKISSPLQPHDYRGAGHFSWRISTEVNSYISVTISSLQIDVRGSYCYNYLVFFDGFDETAPIIKKICGLLKPSFKELRSTSNMMYVVLFLDDSNVRSSFIFDWLATERNSIDDTSETENNNCGSNSTINVSTSIIIKSPNYPSNYDDNLECHWTYATIPGRHLLLKFINFHLEESEDCYFDYVKVYSGLGGTNDWSAITEQLCQTSVVSLIFEASNLLKVEFISDVSKSSIGFFGKIYSVCGGVLTQPSGIVEFLDNDIVPFQLASKCNWTVRVKPMRTIRVTFERLRISSAETVCTRYVSIRNGASIDSPPLGKNKYCGETIPEINELETTGNVLFVSYTGNADRISMSGFRLRYEERSPDCGRSTSLDVIISSQIIQSLNYPEPPLPYSECVWTVMAPPGETLRLDFVERFDLAHSSNTAECTKEYVEIKDGSTAMSPLIGRYCDEKQIKSVKTTGNFVYVKYVTLLANPSDGFKANISIDVCGGTFRSSYGILTSPGYPKYPNLPAGTVCEWRLISTLPGSMWINFVDVDFPDTNSGLSKVKLLIEDVIVSNRSNVVGKVVRSNYDADSYRTISKEVVIKFFYEKPNVSLDSSHFKGFKLNFNSTNTRCGGSINFPSGFINSPGYPQVIRNTMFCLWQIEIPDVSRRIRLEILDFGSTNCKINLYNDLKYGAVLSSNICSNGSAVFESSGNTMAITVLFLKNSKGQRGFRARFTSDKPAICGGKSNEETGMLTSLQLSNVQTYYCQWRLSSAVKSDSSSLSQSNQTMYLRINASSNAWQFNFCRYQSTIIKTMLSNEGYGGFYFFRNKCFNGFEELRIPFRNINVDITKIKNDTLDFNIEWRVQPCGGQVVISNGDGDVLNLPSYTNETSLDCAWIITIPPDRHVEFELEGSFSLPCAQEYLKFFQSTSQNSRVIANFCLGTKITTLSINYRSFYMEYHSNAFTNATTIKLNTRTENLKYCGGTLTGFNKVLMTPNYPKGYKENEECTWDISTSIGNKISLSFDGRFYIEDTVNCTKDFVSVLDWTNDKFTEIKKLCGRIRPQKSINSTSNRMKVIFRSDSNINADGFRARWDMICGGDYVATEQEQFLFSPNYPEFYPNTLNCAYKILANDKIVLIRFDSFDVERGYGGLCNSDNVTLNSLNSYNDNIDTYCGDDLPPVKSYSDGVEIRFRTDFSVTQRGFKIAYKLKTCGGKITNHTIIASGKDGEQYEENRECFWNITAPTNKNVVIRFERFDLEDSRECYFDYVAVFDGLVPDETHRLALLCGSLNSTLPVLRSRGRDMLVQFFSDVSSVFGGFKAQVYFSYGESVGCGGHVNLSNEAQPSTSLRSPILHGAYVYEKYLDCHWIIETSINKVIKLNFTRFNIAPCTDANQTSLGYSNCTCDAVYVYDGANTISRPITTYCGHNIPPTITSSSNFMTIVLYTDGETESAGFEAQLSETETVCGAVEFVVSKTVQHIKSPGYDEGRLARGLHCSYRITASEMQTFRLRINSLDLEPESEDSKRCNRDRLDVLGYSSNQNLTFGHHLIVHSHSLFTKYSSTFFRRGNQAVHTVCGQDATLDVHLENSATITLQTSPDDKANAHRGFDIEISSVSDCTTNYTGLQGWIQQNLNDPSQCNNLITAPPNFTISAYFFYYEAYANSESQSYLDILDGDKQSSQRLIRLEPNTDGYSAAFSTGRHMLIHRPAGTAWGQLDLNYIATNAGRGCGGRLRSSAGVVTSPLYPEPYRAVRACEFLLETLAETRLMLQFQMFDLGSRATCEQIYVELVDRAGVVQRTYCADDQPAEFTSVDNYVKLVYHTTMNTGGSGWVLQFVGISIH